MSKIYIHNREDLKELEGKEVVRDIVFEDDVDFGGGCFEGINRVEGSVDGRGHSVRNIDIDSNGLMKVADVGPIENLHMENSRIFACSSHVGSIVGYSLCDIRGCSLDGGLVRGHDRVGGIVGQIMENDDFPEVKNCDVRGTVISMNEFSGGVVGHKSGGVIESCSSQVFVRGDFCVGGVVGRNYGPVVSCAAENFLTKGEYKLGGLIGEEDSSSGLVEDSWCKGKIVKEETDKNLKCDFIGNFTGYVREGGIENCYWVDVKDNDYDGVGLLRSSDSFVDVNKKCNVEEVLRELVVNEI